MRDYRGGLLHFPSGDGVNLAAIGYVFALEVCSRDLSVISTSGSYKFPRLKFAASDLPGDDLAYLLEVAGVVGGNIYDPAGLEAPDELLDIDRLDKAPLVVAFLRPGVGKG